MCCVSRSEHPSALGRLSLSLRMICGQHPSTVTLGLCTQHPLRLALESQGRKQANASKLSCKGKNYHTRPNGGTSFIHNHNEKRELYSISK